MLYILLLLLAIAIPGLGYQLYQSSRRDRHRRLLEMSYAKKMTASQEKVAAPVERLLKKNSRLVRMSDILDQNIIYKAGIATILSLLLFWVDAQGIYELGSDMLLLGIIAIVAVTILLPDRIKSMAVKRRIKNICNDLPFIIDMMAVCVQSGMTIEAALSYISDNTRDINPDIASMLDRTMLENEVSGIAAALEQLYEEIPANEVRMFCSTLQQSIKYGSSIYQVLIELSKEMRDIQLLAVEEKVASLSARMTIPMIAFIMFPLLIIVAGPGIIGLMSSWGN
jgi:Flp pilus assembly protein TadB